MNRNVEEMGYQWLTISGIVALLALVVGMLWGGR
jgi:hypothetical protein